MPVKRGDADASRTHLNTVVFEYFVRLPDHFHLFFGKPIVLEIIDMGHCVERDLLSKNLRLDILGIQ